MNGRSVRSRTQPGLGRESAESVTRTPTTTWSIVSVRPTAVHLQEAKGSTVGASPTALGLRQGFERRRRDGSEDEAEDGRRPTSPPERAVPLFCGPFLTSRSKEGGNLAGSHRRQRASNPGSVIEGA